MEMMRWGLVPHWAKDKRAPLMINARVESIDSKPVFRDALARKRCLVPADGFFEWQHSGKLKTPMWIHPTAQRFVAFAGLYARAPRREALPSIDRKGGEAAFLHSFTILTGPANELVRSIHDRMPVVLDRSTWAAWLDHDDPQCIAPAAAPAQRSLFE
jgi:putative SOS response-associated peptidase YedK